MTEDDEQPDNATEAEMAQVRRKLQGMWGSKQKSTYHFLHPDNDEAVRLLRQHHGLPPLSVDESPNSAD